MTNINDPVLAEAVSIENNVFIVYYDKDTSLAGSTHSINISITTGGMSDFTQIVISFLDPCT